MKKEYTKTELLELAKKDRSKLSHHQRDLIDNQPKLKERAAKEKTRVKDRERVAREKAKAKEQAKIARAKTLEREKLTKIKAKEQAKIAKVAQSTVQPATSGKRETQIVGKLASRSRQSAYQRYSAKVERYAHMTGMTYNEARQDKYFQFLNKEINRLLAKKERIEIRTRKVGGDVKVATKDIRTSLGELFRASGRKESNDFTALGDTPTI